MRVLITGGAGFIGSHLVEHFQNKAEIVVLDNLRTGSRHNLEGLEHIFMEGCITDPAAVAEAVNGVDFVFHLAAMVSVPESMADPFECERINTLGLINVLQAAAAAKARKLVLASSAAVYGDAPEVPKIETMPPDPKSPYAITKLSGEHYLEMFHRQELLSTASLRFFNVFGPRQNPGSAYAAAVPIFMRNALSGEDLIIYGDGGQTRDFVYVRDVVAALVHAAGQPHVHGPFNIGYGESMTISQLASWIIRLAGSSSEVKHLPERAGDVRDSRASVDKLLATGFRHACSLEQGITETLAWFHNAGSSGSAGLSVE
jgi:UDP-glucose 4-epimerase